MYPWPGPWPAPAGGPPQLCRGPGPLLALARQDQVLVLCLDCLEGYGWEVSPTPVSTEDCALDPQLSQDYLALQQEAGFDLSDDLGCVVTRYTFEILNYPPGNRGCWRICWCGTG